MAGGSGFIGSRVVDILLDFGAKEVVIVGQTAGPVRAKDKRMRFFACDLSRDGSALVIEKLGLFDYVFNLIGLIDQRMPHPKPDELFDANVRTLMNLSKGISWESVRGAVHTGSNAEHGLGSLPHAENKNLEPTNMYGWSKATASLYAITMTKAGLEKWCVARPFFVYGPGKEVGFVPELIKALSQEKTFEISSDTTRDPIYVDDVAEGLVRLALCSEARGEVVNLCSGKEVAIKRIADMVLRKIGKGNIVVKLNARPGDMPRSRGSTKKLKALTGWSPSISLSDGLDKVIGGYENI